MALSEASKESLHLWCFLNEELSLGLIIEPTNVKCDNQSAQKPVQNPVYQSRAKHIDICHYFVRDVFDEGEIDVKYTASKNMPADLLTNALNA